MNNVGQLFPIKNYNKLIIFINPLIIKIPQFINKINQELIIRKRVL